jgi:hypothetical protein
VRRHTHAQRVLEVLRRSKGEFVPHLYAQTGVMVHSRVSDLRKRGHVIEMRRFGPGDYRYRLVWDVETDAFYGASEIDAIVALREAR